MRPRSCPALLFALLMISACLSAEDKTKEPPMSPKTRLDLVRAFTSEIVYAHTTFPIGKKGLTLKNGQVTPAGQDLEQQLAMWGPAVKPGEQMMITDIRIRDNRIHFDVNGGSVKKKKWYNHIQLGVGGNDTMATPEDPKVNPRGSSVDLVFDHYIPEMTPQQFKDLLHPVFDFDAKSRTDAYLETVPPKVKEAIKNHDVLVGMNREMVTYSLGRPPKKIREKDGEVDYEEWIYGEPPQDVHFVRLVGDEVVRVEVMKVDGQKIVRTEKEVDLDSGVTVAKKDSDEHPVNAPTLRRPGEVEETNPRSEGTVNPGKPGPVQDPGVPGGSDGTGTTLPPNFYGFVSGIAR